MLVVPLATVFGCLKRVVGHRQVAQAVFLHRPIGVVGVALIRPVALERPQPVCPAGIGINQ